MNTTISAHQSVRPPEPVATNSPNAFTRELRRGGRLYPCCAHAISGLTGAFVNEDPLYLQSTGFVLDPQGTVMVSVYSSGAIGRLVPGDVIGLVRYLRQHAAASS